MKKYLAISCAIALLAAGAAPAAAGVNCALIKRDLDLGRTPTDISERMAISVADVEKCKMGAGTTADNPAATRPNVVAPTGTPAGTPAPSVAPTGATPPANK